MIDEIKTRKQFLKIKNYLEDKLKILYKEKTELEEHYQDNYEMLKEHLNNCKHKDTEYFSDNFNTCSICGRMLEK